MKSFLIRFFRLNWGLFICSVGIVFMLNANIGYAPWDVFHAGLANSFGTSIGIASIAVGLVICIATVALGEKLGLGTIFNMVIIGLFVDILLFLKPIPIASNFLFGIAMMTIGMILLSYGSYHYIASGFGAGPRDSLMVAVTRKSGFPVGVCRGAIELSTALAGWKLGGMFGAGTIISAFAIGYFIQMTFKLLKFDPTDVQHETLKQTISEFRIMTDKTVAENKSK
ncbi:MAG: hypothetical protein C0604_03620 [Clostridiales bacterium]|nr:MAG: hypothetical protein C0604_03620 [Clostridiales bacterium]